MKRSQLFFNICLMCIAFSVPGYSQEVIVTTPCGETFLFEISSEDTISDVINIAGVFIDPMDHPQKLLVEVDLDEVSPAQKVTWNVKKHGEFRGNPRDYNAPLKPEEVSDIRFIVTFLANRSLITIAAHRSDLENAGDRIDHVHPLKFLGLVFSDEELKVGIRNVRGKGWVWGDFIGGLKESLTTESNNGNMREEYIVHFSQQVKIDPNFIRASIQQRKWDEFIDILIAKVPRDGNHGRFDS